MYQYAVKHNTCLSADTVQRTIPPPRQPTPLQADLARRIAQQIRDGSLAPGAHLTEQALAQQYDVSRTPVRLALRLLQQQGFVESRPNSGDFVAGKAQRLSLERLAAPAMSGELLYRTIITDRATGRLSSTFTEAELQAAHAVPKSLLTRVLLRLTREGLIERRKGHGWSFAPMLDSAQALGESYRFRMLLECGGLRESTFSPSADELRKARAAHERFIEQRPRAQAVDFFEMNAGFHEMLARFSGNRFIAQAVRQQNQLRRFDEYASFVKRSAHLLDSCHEHLQIIEALERNEREWAVALLQRHLSLASRLQGSLPIVFTI
jgi:DNA-binding GntR family transcriptional regulator